MPSQQGPYCQALYPAISQSTAFAIDVMAHGRYHQERLEMEKRIGVRDIARLANVSIGTVDRALNGRKEISEKTRQKILRIVEKYGYQPNPSARALAAAGGSLRVGVCVPRELHYFYDQLREGIWSEAQRLRHVGLELVYRPVEHLADDESVAIRKLLDSGIKALILTPGDPIGLVPMIDEVEK